MRGMSARRTEGASVPLDRALAAFAYRQDGVVSRAQLRELGLSDSRVTARVGRGGLVPVHRGVFAVGHPMLAVRGVWMAAALAGGPHAVLSHAAAGALRELRASHATTIDSTIPGAGGRRRRKDLRIHRARSLDGQTASHDRIPVTTPARTVLDLAATLNPRAIERVLDHAETLRATLTPSELEERFLALSRAAGLPAPLCNHTVAGGDTVAFVFAGQRLLVDRRRDAAHAA